MITDNEARRISVAMEFTFVHIPDPRKIGQLYAAVPLSCTREHETAHFHHPVERRLQRVVADEVLFEEHHVPGVYLQRRVRHRQACRQLHKLINWLPLKNQS